MKRSSISFPAELRHCHLVQSCCENQVKKFENKTEAAAEGRKKERERDGGSEVGCAKNSDAMHVSLIKDD